jgi:phosphoenolpyruvate phosphomutase
MDLVNINRVDNDIYYRTKALYSLYLARENIRDNTIISYGSINFKEHVLEGLLEDEDDITILVDTDFGSQNGEVKDYVFASEPFSRKLFGKNVRFVRMFSNVFGFPNIHGEFIGMWKVNQKGARIVKDTMEKLSGEPDFEKMRLSHLFNEISKTHPISVKYVHGGWLDIYTMADLIKAEELL